MLNFIRYTGMAAGPMISAYLLTLMPSAMSFGLLGLVFAVIELLPFAPHATLAQ